MAKDRPVKPKKISLKDKALEWLVGEDAQVLNSEEVEELQAKAREGGINEERGWHRDNPDSPLQKEAQVTDVSDYSYLYEAGVPTTEEEAKIRLKKPKFSKLRKSFFRAFEAFTGGWVSTWTLFQRGQTVDELFMMQDAVNSRYYTDPHARSILDNWTNYTIGGGLKVQVEVPKVQEWINEFRKRNKMKIREKRLIKRFYIEGELFIAYHDKEGKVYVRRIRPNEVEDIKTDPDDFETVKEYKWTFESTLEGSQQVYKRNSWVPDFRQADFDNGVARKKGTVKVPYVHFIKTTDDDQLRGRVPLQPVIKYLKYYEDWLIDRIRLNHERAKVVWIKEIKGKGATATTRERRAPRGGMMLVENEDVHYRIENPQLQSDEAKEDGLAILYTIGAGANIPIHILNQRSDQQVYASIRKADTPFSQFIRSWQEFFEEEFEDMYRYVIQVAVAEGKLPKRVEVPDYSIESVIQAYDVINRQVAEGMDYEKVVKAAKDVLGPEGTIKKRKVLTVDIPMSLEFPDVIREDPKSQAEVLKIHKEIGIASLSTLASKAGYNWQQELAQILAERQLNPVEEPPEKGSEKNDTGKQDSGTDN